MGSPKNILMMVCFAAAAALAQQPQPPQPQPQPPPPQQQTAPQAPAQPIQVGALNLQNASLTEVIDQLARQLRLNYSIDPSIKGGSVTLNTYGDPRALDARNLLEQILRMNGLGMIDVGGVYRIVPLKDFTRQPIRIQREVNGQAIPEDDQTMLNLVFLKYVSVDELSKILNEFVGENAHVISYAPANLLFILDSRRSMRRTMDLINIFDNDTFTNQRVQIFEVHNTRPSDLVKQLEEILKAISLDTKSATVKFLPIDRINELIAVAPNPGVFGTIEQWLKKLDIPVKITAGDVDNYVYRVKYGQAPCLAMALGQLFGNSAPAVGGGYGGYGASTPYGGG